MSAVDLSLRKYLDWLILSPAIPLAIYFCLSTMLAIVAPYLGIEHPAYWIFGYLGICVVWQLQHIRVRICTIDLVFLLFVAVIFLSWMGTGYTGGNRTVSLVLASTLIPWAAVRVFRESDIARFLQYIGLFGSAVCLVYFLAIPVLQISDAWERVTFLGGSAYGVIGPTVGLLAVMSGIYLMRENLKIAWVTLPVSVIVIVHMGGRGMFVSMFLTFLLGCLLIPSEWKKKAFVLGAVLVSTVIGSTVIPETRLSHFLRLSATIPESRLSRFLRFGFDLDDPNRSVNDTITERLELYRQAVELFLANPLTGVGVGRFGLESWLNQELTTPHSTVFHVISELGLVGAVPFVVFNLMLLSLAFRGFRSATICCVVASVWIYFVIFDQISANYLTSLRYYLFSGLLVTVSLTSNNSLAHVRLATSLKSIFRAPRQVAQK